MWSEKRGESPPDRRCPSWVRPAGLGLGGRDPIRFSRHKSPVLGPKVVLERETALFGTLILSKVNMPPPAAAPAVVLTRFYRLSLVASQPELRAPHRPGLVPHSTCVNAYAQHLRDTDLRVWPSHSSLAPQRHTLGTAEIPEALAPIVDHLSAPDAERCEPALEQRNLASA